MSDSSSQKSGSSEIDDISDEEPMQKYLLIEFSKRGPKSIKSVDVVCSKWVSYNKRNGKLVTKFMKPPYTDENLDLIHKLVENNVDAPVGWPEYNCIIRGQAETYASALLKLSALNAKEYAFTSDSQIEPDEKAKQIEAYYKAKVLHEKQIKMKEQMEKSLFPLESVPSTSRSSTSQINNGSETPVVRNKHHLSCSLNGTRKSQIKKKGEQQVLDTNMTVPNRSGSSMRAETPLSPLMEERLVAIESRLKTIEDLLLTIKVMFHHQENVSTDSREESFDCKYKLTFPCRSQEDLNNLNAALEDSNQCRNDLTKLIKFRVHSGTGIGKAASQILKLCITRDLALNLTAQKKMKGKIVIGHTPFGDLLCDILKTMYTDSTEKNILTAIGDALGNAKDWDGYRKRRATGDAEK